MNQMESFPNKQAICRVGYALNPKKLRKSERSDNVSSSSSGSMKLKPWRGGGLADILEAQSIEDDENCAVLFKPWDYRVPIESQPQFDVIIHKLTEDIDRDSDESREKLSSLEKYLQLHQKTIIVDPISCVRKVVSRARTVECLTTIQRRLGQRCPFKQPNYLIFNEPKSSFEILQLMKEQNMQFPVIGKPIEACGKPHSHNMVVIVSEADLSMLMFPSVLQQYHNHSEQLFKVYVIQRDVMVFCRPSLPTLHPQRLREHHYHSIAFDSRYCYPSIHHFLKTGNDTNIHTNTNTNTIMESPGLDSPLQKMQKTAHQPVNLPQLAVRMSESSSWKLQTPTSPAPTTITNITSTYAATATGAVLSRESSMDGREHAFSPSKLRRGNRTDTDNHSHLNTTIDNTITNTDIERDPVKRKSREECYAELFQSTAAAIQEEFGLTLFGFDVIIPEQHHHTNSHTDGSSSTSNSNHSIEIVVIDINYFPSYKEVEDFPLRLRDYLRSISATTRTCPS